MRPLCCRCRRRHHHGPFPIRLFVSGSCSWPRSPRCGIAHSTWPTRPPKDLCFAQKFNSQLQCSRRNRRSGRHLLCGRGARWGGPLGCPVRIVSSCVFPALPFFHVFVRQRTLACWDVESGRLILYSAMRQCFPIVILPSESGMTLFSLLQVREILSARE